jgi:stage II sporulation protein GA (sporulation sigma-E factor processing peptidase)
LPICGKNLQRRTIGKRMIEVYLDIPLAGALLGLIQDATLLWMVAQITARKPGYRRLLAGGAVGGVFHFFLLIHQASGGQIDHWVLAPPVFLSVPFLMIAVTFGPLKIKRFLEIIGYFYLLAFLLSGFHWGVDMLNRRFWGGEITLWWRFLLHITFIFILGELGWGIIHRKVWEQVCLYTVKIGWDDREIIVNALLDTGNHLVEPLTKAPVVVLEIGQMKPYLPDELQAIAEKVQQGDFDFDERLSDTWRERFRILPFQSIGAAHGMLAGFKVDWITVIRDEVEIKTRNAVVALYPRKLSPEDAFHALISPDLLRG